MGVEQWPQPKNENSGEQLDAMYEKAKSALMDAIIEKVKAGSADDAKAALEDLLVLDRISTIALHSEQNESYDYSVGQEQIDEIADKYGLEKDFSLERFKELAKQVK